VAASISDSAFYQITMVLAMVCIDGLLPSFCHCCISG